ncbi:MAG: sulfate reduction electron transfer complex DsrMKJOP subunit DsrM [Elusimicrobiota bacterium]
MNVLYSLAFVAVLFVIVVASAPMRHFGTVFGIAIPYAAAAAFILGLVYRVVKWGAAPVPFRIPTTCGQQKSLPWIKNSPLDSPHSGLGVLGRMALEVLFFRSLFRNTRSDLGEGPRLTYSESKWLWLGALVFHWSFLVVVLRHIRLFAEPVPSPILLLQSLDGFFQIGVPILYMSGLGLLAAATYLFVRRVALPEIRYISLPADYVPLFLILGIAVSGLLMRHFTKVDIVSVKELAMGLARFSPSVPAGVGTVFYVHLFFVCVLIAYFPVSKLMHMGGVFLSPTRNLANNNRMKRHVNPWNYDVKVHTYEEYEDEFRGVMKDAGMPLEKDA